MPKDLQHVKNSDDDILLQKGYRLYKKIGEGSYAPVYFTEYIGPKGNLEPKKLACKIIDLKKAPKDFVKKFLPRELERKYRYYIFMTMAEKGDLLDYLLVNGALNESRARVWFRQIALALQYLHEMGVAHRDLKCENCLISSNNNLKLADFGFARFVLNNEGKNIASSTYCGSLNYAAPEVLKGSPYYPKNADCWSIGVILYAMLNKSMPFEDKNVKELINQQLNRKWKWRSKVVDYLSNDVKILVRQLLEPDTNTRLKIGDIINSDWIKMDPRLSELTHDEEKCLVRAREELAKYLERQQKRGSKSLGNPGMNSSKLKEIKMTKSDEKIRKNTIMKSQKFTFNEAEASSSLEVIRKS